jgi:hypothetical protein
MVNSRSAETHGGVDAAGFLDDIHVAMTSATHLNWLADIFDFKDGIYSPGDMLLELAEFLWSFAPIVWCTLIIRRLWEFA